MIVSCSVFISIFIVSGAGLAKDLDDDGTITLDAYGFEMSYIYTDIYILEDGSKIGRASCRERV